MRLTPEFKAEEAEAAARWEAEQAPKNESALKVLPARVLKALARPPVSGIAFLRPFHCHSSFGHFLFMQVFMRSICHRF
jgi:hypothetical protein